MSGAALDKLDDADPGKVLPQEAAAAHLKHWWREPAAGLCSLLVGCFDTWWYGRDGGFSTSLDELLVIGGIVLIAGSRRLLIGDASPQALRAGLKAPGAKEPSP